MVGHILEYQKVLEYYYLYCKLMAKKLYEKDFQTFGFPQFPAI